jgi:hypothetical protein
MKGLLCTVSWKGRRGGGAGAVVPSFKAEQDSYNIGNTHICAHVEKYILKRAEGVSCWNRGKVRLKASLVHVLKIYVLSILFSY